MMRRTWVQDVLALQAPVLISDMTYRNHEKIPKGSKYTTGEPKNGYTNYVGIYFEDPTANPNKEVVTGVVQVIKYVSDMRSRGITSIGFDKLIEAGYRGRAEEAQTYIFEFIKDGIVNLREELINEVISGNYESVWRSTNDWLKGLGYEPVEPEDIFPEPVAK